MNFVSRDVIEPILGRACDIYIFILRSNKVYRPKRIRACILQLKYIRIEVYTYLYPVV